MNPSQTATLAGLLIERAYEEAAVNPRVAGQRLYEAEQLLAEVQSHIDNIRETAPDSMDAVNRALMRSTGKMTVEERDRQNKGIAAARRRNRWRGHPGGIRNYV